MNADDDPELLWEQVAGVWPEFDWDRSIATRGAYHRVALFPGEAVIRVSIGGRHAERAGRESQNLREASHLALPVATPAVIGEIRSGRDWSAAALEYLPGRRRHLEPWSAVGATLGRVLGGLHATAVPDGVGLRRVREWCGGRDWPSIASEIGRRLPPRHRRAAAHAVESVLEAEESVEPTLVHGDFGLHNLLWVRDAVSGLIDLDAMCVGDPAMDVAPLLNSFDRAELASVFDSEVVSRAAIHHLALPLQVAAAAELAGDARLRDTAIGNFVDRWEDEV
ncbi:MAG: aminoglycoside 2-phosphotransferase [Microbacteriaceae bacterium]|jgi:Ser/Thr protein kinase RdoA (MazF antagonist)|nr:aminoglycoside 2-phosphotransferase [Microbacteriaceae bacterium]